VSDPRTPAGPVADDASGAGGSHAAADGPAKDDGPVPSPFAGLGAAVDRGIAQGLAKVTGSALGPYQVAIVRIGFALTWLLFLLREFPHRAELYGPDSPWSFDLAKRLIAGNHLEDANAIGFWNARATVLDRDLNETGLHPRGDEDAAAAILGGVLHEVAEQIVEVLPLDMRDQVFLPVHVDADTGIELRDRAFDRLYRRPDLRAAARGYAAADGARAC